MKKNFFLLTASKMSEFPPFLFHIYLKSACNNNFSIIFYLFLTKLYVQTKQEM